MREIFFLLYLVSKNASENQSNSDELATMTNPFFSPFDTSSNPFHAHLDFLRPFLSIPALSFWQTFPFLRPPGLIPPTSPKSTLNPNIHSSSKPSIRNFIHQSKNAKKYKCDICSRAFSRSNTLVTHKVRKQVFSSIELSLL